MPRSISITISVVIIFLAAVLWGKPTSINAVPFDNYLELFGGYMEAATNIGNNPSSFVFQGWVKPTNTDGYRPIVSVGTLQHVYEIALNGGSLTADVRYSSNSRKVITAGFVPYGVWTKVEVSIDSSSISLFINDAHVFSTSGASPLRAVGAKIRVGKSINAAKSTTFQGAVDELVITVDESPYVIWHLDEPRGEFIATDTSGNGFDASLVGTDDAIHFFGIPPTPTPRPTIGIIWNRILLPTLSLPSWFPTRPPAPTSDLAQPTTTPSTLPGDVHDPDNRPVYPRR